MGGCAGKFKTVDGLKSPASNSADGAKEGVLNTENSKSLAEAKINEPIQTDKNSEDKDVMEPFVETVKDGVAPNENGEGKEDAKEQAAEGKKSDDVKKQEAVSA